jgi:hypothetical protein
MIKKVKFNIFDVWFGRGWYNWVRMIYREGKWQYLKGDKKYEDGAALILSNRLTPKEKT